jgi:chromatin modification-related protein EAF6
MSGALQPGALAGAAGAAGARPPAQQLQLLLQRKVQLDEDLRQIEKEIFKYEEEYIDESSNYGNVIKGWDGFLTSKPKVHTGTRRPRIPRKDRIFSNSSLTAPVPEEEATLEDEAAGRVARRLNRTADMGDSEGEDME